MKLFQRVMVFMLSVTWSIILFWYFGSLLFFVLPVLGIDFIVIGGKINV